MNFVRNHHRVLLMGRRSAEFTLYAANALLATRIGFMNELSRLAERAGVGIERVRQSISTAPRGQSRAALRRRPGRQDDRSMDLAFKPNIDGMREAPSCTVVAELARRGARIRARDPLAGKEAARVLDDVPGMVIVGAAAEALQGADALAIVTEWKEFRTPDFEAIKAALRTPVVFDGRNLYEPEVMAAFGLEYHCIGRPPPLRERHKR